MTFLQDIDLKGNSENLSMVKGKDCILTSPFDKICDLGISSGFIHQLQERFVQM